MKKSLDKLLKVCYNKNVKRTGTSYIIKKGWRPTPERKKRRKEKTMTNREFLTAVISADLSEEMTKHAADLLTKMDERNAKRNSTPSKTAIANEPIKAAIAEVLTDEPQTATDIAAKVEVSTQKASALLRQLVADGKAVQSEVKVPKKGKQKAYALPTE